MKSLLIAVMMLGAFAAHAHSYAVVSSSSTTIGSFTRTAYTVQDGSDTQERFTMTRVRKTTPRSGGPRASLLLLPGSSANFELYEVQTTGTYTDSFAGHFANADYEVWGYSPRSKQFAANACDTETNCVVMADWGLATIAADADYIRSQIATTVGGDIVLVGWSMGAISTYATLDLDPTGFDAAVIWEGALYSTNTGVVAGNTVNCASSEARLLLGEVSQLGLFFGGTSTTGVLKTIADTVSDPLRHTLLENITTTPLPSPPSYVPNYKFFQGNGALISNYKYASEAILLSTLDNAFNAYESGVVNRDIYCSLAGSETSFTDNLSSFTGKIYVLESGHGFGPYMAETLALLGTTSGNRTITVQSDYGHGDHFAQSSHKTVLENPLTTWLNGMYP